MNKLIMLCTNCKTKEQDMSRLHITKEPDEIGGNIIISYWCIGCGAEITYIFTKETPDHELLKSLYEKG